VASSSLLAGKATLELPTIRQSETIYLGDGRSAGGPDEAHVDDHRGRRHALLHTSYPDKVGRQVPVALFSNRQER
jgi:hypothetical protein